jgi:hypothetical protein
VSTSNLLRGRAQRERPVSFEPAYECRDNHFFAPRTFPSTALDRLS